MNNKMEIKICLKEKKAIELMTSLIKYVPFGHAYRESIRMISLKKYDSLEMPVLDIGCGDGTFWKIITGLEYEKKDIFLEELLGIDINEDEIKLARKNFENTGAMFEVINIEMNLKGHALEKYLGKFKTIIANSSVEHIPDLRVVFENANKLLHPEGTFILFVPAYQWTDTFWSTRILNKISSRIGGMYSGMLNGVFRHYHTYDYRLWKLMLENAGFTSVNIMGLGSKAGNRLYETWLFLSFPALIFKSMFKRYPFFAMNSLKIKLLCLEKKFLNSLGKGLVVKDNLDDGEIVEYFIECKK